MSLAGAAVANKDDGLGAPDVITPREFINLLGRDLGIALKVELLQGLHTRQAGFADPALDQSLVAFLQFGLQQRFEITQVGAGALAPPARPVRRTVRRLPGDATSYIAVGS